MAAGSLGLSNEFNNSDDDPIPDTSDDSDSDNDESGSEVKASGVATSSKDSKPASGAATKKPATASRTRFNLRAGASRNKELTDAVQAVTKTVSRLLCQAVVCVLSSVPGSAR